MKSLQYIANTALAEHDAANSAKIIRNGRALHIEHIRHVYPDNHIQQIRLLDEALGRALKYARMGEMYAVREWAQIEEQDALLKDINARYNRLLPELKALDPAWHPKTLHLVDSQAA